MFKGVAVQRHLCVYASCDALDGRELDALPKSAQTLNASDATSDPSAIGLHSMLALPCKVHVEVEVALNQGQPMQCGLL